MLYILDPQAELYSPTLELGTKLAKIIVSLLMVNVSSLSRLLHGKPIDDNELVHKLQIYLCIFEWIFNTGKQPVVAAIPTDICTVLILHLLQRCASSK